MGRLMTEPMHRACFLFAALSLAAGLAHADTSARDDLNALLAHRPTEIRLGVERVMLPGNEAMGLLGAAYLIQVVPGFYAGPALYGAVSGQRGGFFTEGVELAWRQRIAIPLELEAGIYAGGGGGGAAQVGGGLMLRPHADLLWDFGGYRVGISASRVRFVNGRIGSSQLGLVFSADGDFSYFPPGFMGRRVAAQGHGGTGFDRVLVAAGAYRPRAGSVNGAASAPGSIGYVGARFEQFFTPRLYRGIEAVGGASGGVAGYAEFLGTVGAEIPVWEDRLAVGARLALGMGGGGAVAMGGGALAKAGAYAMVNVSRNSHLALEGGYATAPSGRFRAAYGSANLVWDLDHPYTAGPAILAENEWVAGTEHYFGAARKDGSRLALDALVIKLNRYVTPSLYLTGQAHSAYSGNAGAYSAGLVGLGWRSPVFAQGFSAGAEFLLGAAGGGGVNTSGGAIVQPMIYLDRDITRALGVRLAAGRIKSFAGPLNSTVVDLSARFAFGTAAR